MSTPGITELTGLRSSKPTWYAEYRQTADKLTRALGSLDRIAQVLSATGQGADALCRAVVDAAADHLGASWVVLALREDALPLARPRLVARGPAGDPVHRLADLPGGVGRAVAAGLAAGTVEPRRDRDGAVVVPLVVDGEAAGVLVAWVGPRATTGPADLAILRIVGNQSAVALLSDHLLAEAEQRARDLAERHRQLAEAERRLDDAAQREAVDVERHRIARELHDSVAQHVLSAGMTIEWCRPEVEHHREVYERLDHAKALTREAVERLRGAIHALSADPDHTEDLPARLARLPQEHPVPGLAVAVRVEGRPVDLPPPAVVALHRIATECLFNTTRHAGASRCTVRLAYRPGQLRLSVADDGTGSPEVLRRALRTPDGRHRGLVNMASRAAEVGARLRVGRARLGGVRVDVVLPLAGPGG
ncbi:histidine kinase [Klenkia sp. LSe6-5]|uniref:histidine kinase n=1 Tax=Klenkia sesuvii TaxID=3103137 RepID=A0ABU8DRK1_9ACTN